MFYSIYTKYAFLANTLQYIYFVDIACTIYMLDPVCSYDPVCKPGARFANGVDFPPGL